MERRIIAAIEAREKAIIEAIQSGNPVPAPVKKEKPFAGVPTAFMAAAPAEETQPEPEPEPEPMPEKTSEPVRHDIFVVLFRMGRMSPSAFQVEEAAPPPRAPVTSTVSGNITTIDIG